MNGVVSTSAGRDEPFERDMLGALPALASYARSLTHDASDADDLVQETFLLAYRGYHTFRVGEDPRAWLFTICRNAFRRQRRRSVPFVGLDDLGDPVAETMEAVHGHVAAQRDGTAARLETLDLGPRLSAAIAELPERFREAVTLVDLQDLTYDDAARVLGVPLGTVRSRLYRGRRLLQDQLLDHARDAGLVAARQPGPNRVRTP